MSVNDDSSESLERRAREMLDESAERLDGRIRSRLTQARSAAVEEARQAQRRFAWRAWIPAGALAGAAALAVFVWSGAPHSPGTPALAVHSSLDDLDIMVTNESFELLEDLEFYEWVAAGDADAATIG
jgi:hypothetical protein